MSFTTFFNTAGAEAEDIEKDSSPHKRTCPAFLVRLPAVQWGNRAGELHGQKHVHRRGDPCLENPSQILYPFHPGVHAKWSRQMFWRRAEASIFPPHRFKKEGAAKGNPFTAPSAAQSIYPSCSLLDRRYLREPRHAGSAGAVRVSDFI